LKVIDFGAKKANMHETTYATSYCSLIVTLYISPTVFEILTHLALKWLVFPHTCLTPLSGGKSSNINVFYTPLTAEKDI